MVQDTRHMQTDQDQQQTREEMVNVAQRKYPKRVRQMTSLRDDYVRRMRLRRHSDAALDHGKDDDVERPMRYPRKAVEQEAARRSRRRPLRLGTQQNANEHHEQDEQAGRSVLEQGMHFPGEALGMWASFAE